MRPLHRRPVAWALGALLLGGAAAASFVARYPGFTRGFLADLRLASWDDVVTQVRFLVYYAKNYALLREDPATHYVDLEVAAAADPSADESERAWLAFHRGAFGEARDLFRADLARGESEDARFGLGVSSLRLAEAESCVSAPEGAPVGRVLAGARHPLAPCALPFAVRRHRPAAAQEATESFLALLDDHDAEDPVYRWLLTFSSMLAGTYPEGVPARYRIAGPFLDGFVGERAAATAARFADLRLVDRAAELGVATDDAGKGVAVEDFDLDGDLDVVTGGTFDPLRYYRNEAGRGFVERTGEAGFGGVVQPYVVTAADFDGDGAPDLFVSRPFTFFALLRNRGDGTFHDETFERGLLARRPGPDEAVYTVVSAWSDFDLDSDLDLFLAQYGQRTPFAGGLLAREPMPSVLFENEGGRFRDVTAERGLEEHLRDGIFLGAAWGDLDGDEYPELFVSSFERRRTLLLANLGGRRFAPLDLPRTPEPGFMAAVVDVDHDGRLDLFQGSQSPARTTTARAVFGSAPGKGGPKLFLQTDAGFVERKDLFDGGTAVGSMGASYGDLDGDGCWDFYLGSGNPESWLVMPHLAYLGERDGNRCTGRMSDVSALSGLGTIQKGHGIVFFDFDLDGDQDLYSSLGGMWPGDAWPNQLFVNESRFDNRWTAIRLRGRTKNSQGVGARLTFRAVDGAGAEIVRRAVIDARTGFGSAPFEAHLGLAKAVRLDEVEVRWPGGPTQRLRGLPLDRRLVVEGPARLPGET